MFTGEIEAVDTVNNAYRVEFENPRLGIQTVADIEVMVSAIFVTPVKTDLVSCRVCLCALSMMTCVHRVWLFSVWFLLTEQRAAG